MTPCPVGPAGSRRRYAIADPSTHHPGGGGVVFEAALTQPWLDAAPGERVALKAFAKDRVSAERFAKMRARSEAVRQVRHPHLGRHLECFVGPPPAPVELPEEECDEWWSASVWVEGSSLTEVAPTAAPDELVEWGHELAEGLDFLHTHPLGAFAHRDVHAGNVVVEPDGTAVLIDFDTILWEPTYGTNLDSLSPRAGTGDGRADLAAAQQADRCALAAMLLHLLAGDPHRLLDPAHACAAAAARTRDALGGNTARAMNLLAAAAVGGAPASARQLLDDFEATLLGKGPVVAPMTAAAPPPRRRRGWKIAAFVACLFALVLGGFYAAALFIASPSQAVFVDGTGPDSQVLVPAAGQASAAAAQANSYIEGLRDGQAGAIAPARPSRSETARTQALTVSDPATGTGNHGPSLGAGSTVLVSCRRDGAQSAGGTWWYELNESPWNGVYWAAAGHFGPLDTAVPVCP